MRLFSLGLVDLEDILHGTCDAVFQVLEALLHPIKTTWDDFLLLASEEALLKAACKVPAVDEAKVLERAMDAAHIRGAYEC